MKLRKNVKVADRVRQLESWAEERIMDTAFCRWGTPKTLHFSNSKDAFARFDRSLDDVSFKEYTRTQLPSQCHEKDSRE